MSPCILPRFAQVRSQQEVQMTMNRLIALEERQEPPKPDPSGAGKRPKGKKPPPGPPAQAVPTLAPGQPDLTSRGLVCWFGFEDGAGASRLFDLSEGRYPVPLSRNMLPLPLLPPKIPEAAAVGVGVGAGVGAGLSRGMSPIAGDKPPNPDFLSLPTSLAPTLTSASASGPDPNPDAPPSSPPRLGFGTPGSALGDRRLSSAGAAMARTLLARGAHKATPWFWLDADGLPLPNSPPVRPGDDRPLPVPSFSSRGVCPYELKRLRLAQRGRQLYKEMPCPMLCGQIITKKDTRFHIEYECMLRIVPCRHAPLCLASFPLAERAQHEAKGPSPACAHTLHVRELWRTFEFANEPVACEHCALEVRRRHMQAHLLKDCPHRAVHCPHAACDREVQFHALEAHLRHDCPQERDRAFLVLRARERLGYPRAWAIEVPFLSSTPPASPSTSPERGPGEAHAGAQGGAGGGRKSRSPSPPSRERGRARGRGRIRGGYGDFDDSDSSVGSGK